MASDDESEMRDMRSSARFVPRVARKTTSATAGRDVDVEEQDYWVAGAAGSGAGGARPPAPSEDDAEASAAERHARAFRETARAGEDDDDAPAVVDAEELRRAGLPTDFGHHAAPGGTSGEDVAAALRAAERKRAREGSDRLLSSLSAKDQLAAHTAEFREISAKAPGSPEPGGQVASSEGLAGDVEAEEEEEREEESEYDRVLPVSHEIVLRGHSKPVNAMAIDASGARLATGGHDYGVKLWDFGGMDMRLHSFRSVEPMSGHVVTQISFSPSGDCFVCTTASQQPKIYDRDARELLMFEKGDQYLTDMNNTRGHVAIVTNAVWHPRDKNVIMTSSLDGTMRLWDPMDVTRHKAVIKGKIKTPRLRAAMTASTFDASGSKVAAAISVEGSIQVWPTKGPYHRPAVSIENAHFPGSDTSCLRFFSDDYTMLSRGMDDSMKIWDLRKPKAPVHVWGDLNNSFPQTDCCISPDERFIVTGTSGFKADPSGALRFYSRDTFEMVKEIAYEGASVIRCLWHAKNNQIVVGLSDSSAHVLFDPKLSQRGALLCVARSMPKADPYKLEFASEAINPHALPMFRREPSKKKQFAKMRKDPVATKMPDIVRTGPGKGGRLGSCHTAHLLKALGYANNPVETEDPREALLKYDQKAKEKSFFFKAYDETQPKQIFAEPDEQEQQPPAAKRPKA